jgi:hypothetical protein
MTGFHKKLCLIASALLLSCGAVWAAYETASQTAPALSAWAPQGALLAIEARDFSGLLKDWSTSAQKRAWLTSDNYADFSRSRLFSRLGEAQQQFAVSAGLPADMNFLAQVAGKESLFAWYDIGNLEFLYITHMPSSASEQTQLLQERSKFEARKAGDETFYVRSQGEPRRTVAFAVHGDYLLLATREDLLANALLLMRNPHGKDGEDLSLRDERWYATAAEAAAEGTGDLRMTLNLATIVPSPYFRSYWVQRNISEMKQYSAAITDLYRTPQSFREERALLPKTSENMTAAADVAPLLQYLPASAGVYRANAHPSTDQVVAIFGEKLLFRDASEFHDTRVAPVADLTQQTVGSASDLETRIDAPPIPQEPMNVALAPLHALLDSAHVQAMLVGSSTGEAADVLFLPVHSSVVLSASGPWNADALKSALTEALRARLTAGSNGLLWQSRHQGSLTWFELEGLQPLAFALQGNLCVLSTDSATLLQSLDRPHDAAPKPQLVSVAAGFNHSMERPHFARITGLLDQSSKGQPSNNQAPSQPDNATPPAFFSGNIRSLSDTFQTLDAETFVEQPQPDAHIVRQTVLYQWRH